MITQKIINIIFIVVIAILVLVLVFKKSSPPLSVVKKDVELQHKYDSLQVENNKLKDTIYSYNNTIISLNNFSDALLSQYKTKKNEIEKLRSKNANKNATVDKLNVVELESEFSKRYDTASKR